jgi:hypothetical protein
MYEMTTQGTEAVLPTAGETAAVRSVAVPADNKTLAGGSRRQMDTVHP